MCSDLRYHWIFPDAGWSSPVARWAHNPKVAGSNPAPATKPIVQLDGGRHRPPPSTFRELSENGKPWALSSFAWGPRAGEGVDVVRGLLHGRAEVGLRDDVVAIKD